MTDNDGHKLASTFQKAKHVLYCSGLLGKGLAAHTSVERLGGRTTGTALPMAVAKRRTDSAFDPHTTKITQFKKRTSGLEDRISGESHAKKTENSR